MTEEGDDPGGGGRPKCCKEVEKHLKSEFEQRFEKIEKDMKFKEGEVRGLVKELKQCVAVKDMEIGKRDKIINELKQKEQIRENVIRELKAEVRKMSEGKTLQNANKNAGRRTGIGGRRDDVASAAPGTMEDIFGRPYAKYFSLEFKSETIKRDMCPYRMEADISEQMGGKPKTITSKSPSAVLVEVASEEQSRLIREVKTVLERECEVKEHSLYNGRASYT